jgi:hypothetical protein
MPPKSKPTAAPSQIKTRSKNKHAHPGIPDRAPPRRTSVEVENERAAKAQAQAAQHEENRRYIRRAAAFEDTDLANEDTVDASPRPYFTPKPCPPPRNRKKASLCPVAEVSDDSNDKDTLSFKPLCSASGESATEEESGAESDPPPPAKKLKAQTTGKAIPKVGRATHTKKTGKAEEMVPASNEAIAPASGEETPRKPNKTKSKMRDRIDEERKKIEEDRIREKNGDMAKPTSSQQAGEERSGTSTPQTPLQVEERTTGWAWGRALKRVGGAITDIKACSQQSDQSSNKRAQPDDNNPIRQVTLSLLPHVRVIADP